MVGQILLEDFPYVLILAFSVPPEHLHCFITFFFPDLQKLKGKMSSETQWAGDV